jgi:predicted amidophosphoribosyltransferase
LALLDVILPQRCVACGEPGTQVCERCLGGFPRLLAPLCARCGAPTAWPVARCAECTGRRLAFESARAAVAYSPAVKAFVSAWKERGLRRLAAISAGLVAEVLPRPAAAALAFVPPDPERSRKRGHHPAARLAEELGFRWSLPVEALLVRSRTVPPQRGLSLDERRRNVRGAFGAAGDAPRHLVLVDDVYTSGATANAAASALRAAGARRVEVVTLARAVR